MANAKHGSIIDYAMPMMKIENLMRQVHDLCLLKQYEKANELCPLIIAEARVLSASLVLMVEKEKE
jgi:hypothetical protein